MQQPSDVKICFKVTLKYFLLKKGRVVSIHVVKEYQGTRSI